MSRIILTRTTSLEMVDRQIAHTTTPYGHHFHEVPIWLPDAIAERLYTRRMARCPENHVTRDQYYAREPHEMSYVLTQGLDWNNSDDHARAVRAVEEGWLAPTPEALDEAHRTLNGGTVTPPT